MSSVCSSCHSKCLLCGGKANSAEQASLCSSCRHNNNRCMICGKTGCTYSACLCSNCHSKRKHGRCDKCGASTK